MKRLEQIQIDVLDSVRSTAEFMRKAQLEFEADKIEFKGTDDLVSYVDKQAEERLIAACKSILPQAGIIAEESGEADRKTDLNWIIDPLDGTTNFIHGLPIWSISLALVDKLDPILGIVFDVPGNELFSAIKGGGTYLNGEAVFKNNAQTIQESLIGTGFPYSNFDMKGDYMSLFEAVEQKSRGVRRLGSAAIDLAWTACGRFAGFYETGLQSWDVAAGALLIQEAGGKVSDFSGGEDWLFGRQIVATNDVVHDELLRIISKYY